MDLLWQFEKMLRLSPCVSGAPCFIDETVQVLTVIAGPSYKALGFFPQLSRLARFSTFSRPSLQERQSLDCWWPSLGAWLQNEKTR